MPVRSLLFLLEEEKVLLAMKKRGFGVGLWNGVGGKPEPGETMDETAVRECEEEIHVTPLRLSLVAVLNFYMSTSGPLAGYDQQAYTYLCTQWRGWPEETEEMRPQWFDEGRIPYDAMWSYSSLALPRLLAGEKIHAEFYFDDDHQVITHSIRPLDV